MGKSDGLPRFIQSYFQSHSMSINDLAKNMGVPHSTVARWASGKTEPSLKQLNKLAMTTSTSLCDLVELLYPQSSRSVSPDIARLAEQISHLPIQAQELIDSIILGLSIKGDKKDANVS